MKRGGLADSAQGFTIVETLIVLAVTSMLFVSVALLINGRQNRTDFLVGVRSLQQQFQQIINETISGYYPNNSNFSCSVAGPPLSIISGSTAQGSNQDCIFVGNTIVVGGPAHLDNYSVYPLAGRRAINGVDVKTPQEARITAIAQSTANPHAPFVGSVKLPNNLVYSKARLAGSPSWTTGSFAVAFLSSLGNFQGTINTTGSQQLNLASYSSWSSSMSDADNINAEANRGALQYPIASSGVEYCFNSGGTAQSVVVAISPGLAVTTSVKTGLNCP